MTAINLEANPYKQILTQKLLGRNYKWWYVIKYYFKLDGAYFFTNLFHFFGQSISVYTAFFIWYQVNSSKEVITNLLIGLVIFALTSNTMYWNIGGLIENGKFSKSLILPSDTILMSFVGSIGFALRVITYYSIILAPILFFFLNSALPIANIYSLGIICLMCVIAFIIRFLISVIIGFSTFWTTQVYGQANFYENLLPLLTGLLFPYDLITLNILKQILTVLPWSFITYHPMQIYLGKYSALEALYVFGGGIVWCVILYYLAKWVFKMGLKRNEAVGL